MTPALQRLHSQRTPFARHFSPVTGEARTLPPGTAGTPSRLPRGAGHPLTDRDAA